MSVIFSEADKFFDMNSLDEKSKEVLYASRAQDEVPQEALDDLRGELRAKYKIEVILPPRRKVNEAIACAVTAFKSGGQLHGGGDELLYVCRNEKDATIGCGSVLKGNPLVGTVDGGLVTVFYCDKCQKYVNRELLASTFLYKLPLKKLAENIYRLFRQLDSNADIYLKHMKTDIRNATLDRKQMTEVPKKMEYAIYTLKNIVKDTSNDSQVLHKIETFLKA